MAQVADDNNSNDPMEVIMLDDEDLGLFQFPPAVRFYDHLPDPEHGGLPRSSDETIDIPMSPVSTSDSSFDDPMTPDTDSLFNEWSFEDDTDQRFYKGLVFYIENYRSLHGYKTAFLSTIIGQNDPDLAWDDLVKKYLYTNMELFGRVVSTFKLDELKYWWSERQRVHPIAAHRHEHAYVVYFTRSAYERADNMEALDAVRILLKPLAPSEQVEAILGFVTCTNARFDNPTEAELFFDEFFTRLHNEKYLVDEMLFPEPVREQYQQHILTYAINNMSNILPELLLARYAGAYTLGDTNKYFKRLSNNKAAAKKIIRWLSRFIGVSVSNREQTPTANPKFNADRSIFITKILTYMRLRDVNLPDAIGSAYMKQFEKLLKNALSSAQSTVAYHTARECVSNIGRWVDHEMITFSSGGLHDRESCQTSDSWGFSVSVQLHRYHDESSLPEEIQTDQSRVIPVSSGVVLEVTQFSHRMGAAMERTCADHLLQVLEQATVRRHGYISFIHIHRSVATEHPGLREAIKDRYGWTEKYTWTSPLNRYNAYLQGSSYVKELLQLGWNINNTLMHAGDADMGSTIIGTEALESGRSLTWQIKQVTPYSQDPHLWHHLHALGNHDRFRGMTPGAPGAPLPRQVVISESIGTKWYPNELFAILRLFIDLGHVWARPLMIGNRVRTMFTPVFANWEQLSAVDKIPSDLTPIWFYYAGDGKNDPATSSSHSKKRLPLCWIPSTRTIDREHAVSAADDIQNHSHHTRDTYASMAWVTKENWAMAKNTTRYNNRLVLERPRKV